MNVKMPREQEVIQEALEILEKHMEPSKVALLLSILQAGEGDYLAIREELFSGETVRHLLEGIQAYQEANALKHTAHTNSDEDLDIYNSAVKKHKA